MKYQKYKKGEHVKVTINPHNPETKYNAVIIGSHADIYNSQVFDMYFVESIKTKEPSWRREDQLRYLLDI
jgi:ribosomal protein L21E